MTMCKTILAAAMLAAISGPAMAWDEYGDTDRIIHQQCAKEWPDNFHGRAGCERVQRKSLEELRQNNPTDKREVAQ
jgi:hypothetical protein